LSAARYDAIVAGTGTMGSAALYHLARRGKRVLGLDRWELPHTHGSMHGRTRVIRLAYHEHLDYVPLLLRAYELWRDLERRAGRRLLHEIGSIEVGVPDGWIVAGAVHACEVHDLPYELLEPAEVTRRHPALRPGPGTVGLVQADSGYLLAEESVAAHVAQALAAGAELHIGERVVGWDASVDTVTVRTDAGSYEADRLVLAPGAWAPSLMQLPPELLRIERQVVGWFDPVRRDDLTSDRLPVWVFEDGEDVFYGFPALDQRGVKLGLMHHPGDAVDPDAVPPAAPGETAALRAFLEQRLPDAAGELLEAQACLFTMAPDGAFVLDLHPDAPNVVIVSACSGHGFKFASVVGEIAADLAESGATPHSIDFLRYARFPNRSG
jgi:sarcosine oxidase